MRGLRGSIFDFVRVVDDVAGASAHAATAHFPRMLPFSPLAPGLRKVVGEESQEDSPRPGDLGP